jgi:predicted nucleic acid-binding protein
VAAEINAQGRHDPAVEAIRQVSWLTVVPNPGMPEAIRAFKLDAGEAAVLALAYGDRESEVVLDDLAGRRCAARLGIPCIGSVGIVLAAKRLGMIATARPVIEQLLMSGLYLDDELVEDILKRIGE